MSSRRRWSLPAQVLGFGVVAAFGLVVLAHLIQMRLDAQASFTRDVVFGTHLPSASDNRAPLSAALVRPHRSSHGPEEAAPRGVEELVRGFRERLRTFANQHPAPSPASSTCLPPILKSLLGATDCPPLEPWWEINDCDQAPEGLTEPVQHSVRGALPRIGGIDSDIQVLVPDTPAAKIRRAIGVEEPAVLSCAELTIASALLMDAKLASERESTLVQAYYLSFYSDALAIWSRSDDLVQDIVPVDRSMIASPWSGTERFARGGDEPWTSTPYIDRGRFGVVRTRCLPVRMGREGGSSAGVPDREPLHIGTICVDFTAAELEAPDTDALSAFPRIPGARSHLVTVTRDVDNGFALHARGAGVPRRSGMGLPTSTLEEDELNDLASAELGASENPLGEVTPLGGAREHGWSDALIAPLQRSPDGGWLAWLVVLPTRNPAAWLAALACCLMVAGCVWAIGSRFAAEGARLEQLRNFEVLRGLPVGVIIIDLGANGTFIVAGNDRAEELLRVALRPLDAAPDGRAQDGSLPGAVAAADVFDATLAFPERLAPQGGVQTGRARAAVDDSSRPRLYTTPSVVETDPDGTAALSAQEEGPLRLTPAQTDAIGRTNSPARYYVRLSERRRHTEAEADATEWLELRVGSFFRSPYESHDRYGVVNSVPKQLAAVLDELAKQC